MCCVQSKTNCQTVPRLKVCCLSSVEGASLAAILASCVSLTIRFGYPISDAKSALAGY